MVEWFGRVLVVGVYAGGILFWTTAGARGDEAPPTDDAIPAEVTRRIAELDGDGDGRLGPGEFPFDAAAFERADTDGDGVLAPRELLRFRAIEETREKRARRGDQSARKFREADENDDGVVTREEFPAPDALFERFDRDGDGRVRLEEAEDFFVEEMIAQVYAKHDADMSGTLSLDEAPQEVRRYFAAADADRDGELTGEECYGFIAEVWEAAESTPAPRRSGGAETAEPTPSPRPSGGGDVVEAKEEAAGSRAAPGGGELGVLGVLLASRDRFDRDGDGLLTPEEVPASRALLERIDVDGDGAVSRAELEVREGHAQRLGARAEALKARAKRLGAKERVTPYAVEGKALFVAGRYEEVAELLDEIELRIAAAEDKQR